MIETILKNDLYGTILMVIVSIPIYIWSIKRIRHKNKNSSSNFNKNDGGQYTPNLGEAVDYAKRNPHEADRLGLGSTVTRQDWDRYYGEDD